jgi:hypothetical protein
MDPLKRGEKIVMKKLSERIKEIHEHEEALDKRANERRARAGKIIEELRDEILKTFAGEIHEVGRLNNGISITRERKTLKIQIEDEGLYIVNGEESTSENKVLDAILKIYWRHDFTSPE